MKRSIGVTMVCGQLPSLPYARRHLPASAIRSSHSCLALRLDRQRLHRAYAEHRLAQRRVLGDLGGDDTAVDNGQRPQKHQDDDGDQAGAGQHQPSERRVQPEQERQQHAERHQVEEGRQQLAGDELAHLLDLHDVVHRLAGRVPLEIVERQAQQAVEHVQVESRVDPGADDQHDQSSCIAQQRFVEDGDADDDRDQRQGRIGTVGQHLVDHRHNQERREDGR